MEQESRTAEEPYLNFSESIRICAKTLHIDESGIGIIESLVNHVIKESVNEKDVSLNEKNASLNHCIQFEHEQSKLIQSLESKLSAMEETLKAAEDVLSCVPIGDHPFRNTYLAGFDEALEKYNSLKSKL